MTYRTPEEYDAHDVEDARIELILDRAHDNLTSLLAAITLGENENIVEDWVDTTYNYLRDQLDPENRIRAIILLLADGASAAVNRVLDTDSVVSQ